MKSLSVFLLATASAGAMAQVTTVSPYDMNGWSFFDDLTGGPCLSTSTCEIAAAPVANPSGGTGAVHLAATVNADRPRIGTKSAALAGKPFASLVSMRYDTLVVANPASPAQAIALQFDFDNDVTDTDDGFKGRIVFEPYWSGVNPAKGAWQTWDASTGRWWLTRAPQFVAAGVLPQLVCHADNPCTLQVLTQYLPKAGIADGAGRPNVFLAAGSFWPGFDGYADNLVAQFGTETVDVRFDLGPQSKQDCMDGGWVGFTRNLGQCVSAFSSSKP